MVKFVFGLKNTIFLAYWKKKVLYFETLYNLSLTVDIFKQMSSISLP